MANLTSCTRALATALATLIVSHAAAAAEPPAGPEESPLLAWEGKYPSEAVVAEGTPLLQQPGVRKALQGMLPRGEAALLTHLDVESKVRREGDMLVVEKCRPHACPDDAATVVIDMRSGALWAAFFTRSSHGVAARWYASKPDAGAPPPAVATFFDSLSGQEAPHASR